MVPRKTLIAARGNRKQKEIAKLCGIKQQTYSHWETGRCTPPISKIIVLEKILNIPKEVLFLDIFNS